MVLPYHSGHAWHLLKSLDEKQPFQESAACPTTHWSRSCRRSAPVRGWARRGFLKRLLLIQGFQEMPGVSRVIRQNHQDLETMWPYIYSSYGEPVRFPS